MRRMKQQTQDLFLHFRWSVWAGAQDKHETKPVHHFSYLFTTKLVSQITIGYHFQLRRNNHLCLAGSCFRCGMQIFRCQEALAARNFLFCFWPNCLDRRTCVPHSRRASDLPFFAVVVVVLIIYWRTKHISEIKFRKNIAKTCGGWCKWRVIGVRSETRPHKSQITHHRVLITLCSGVIIQCFTVHCTTHSSSSIRINLNANFNVIITR